METTWDFVEKYYPNYSSSDLIAYANDLGQIRECEWSKAAKELFQRLGRDINVVDDEYKRVHMEIYEGAIEGYINSLK